MDVYALLYIVRQQDQYHNDTFLTCCLETKGITLTDIKKCFRKRPSFDLEQLEQDRNKMCKLWLRVYGWELQYVLGTTDWYVIYNMLSVRYSDKKALETTIQCRMDELSAYIQQQQQHSTNS